MALDLGRGGRHLPAIAELSRVHAVDLYWRNKPYQRDLWDRAGLTRLNHAQVGSHLFIVALVAGALGFTDIAAGTASVAKVLFAIFLIVFLVLLVVGIRAGQTLF